MKTILKKATGKVGLKAGTVVNWTSFIVQAVTTLLLTPIVIAHLGKAGYGIWVLVNALGGYYGLVNVGLGSALIRHISLHATRGEDRDLRAVLATALTFFTVTGCLILILTGCFAGWIVGFFGISETDRSAAEGLVRLLGFATALDFSGVVFTSLLNAYERFLIVGILNLARTVIRFVVFVSVLHAGMGLLGLGIGAAAMSLLLISSNFFLVRYVHGPGLLGFRAASFANLRVLLVYGGSTFLMNIVNLARTKLGHLVLARYAGLSSVALFGICSSLVMQFNGMVASTVTVLTARFARLDAGRREEEIRTLFQKSLFICGSVSFAFGLLVWLFGERFIILWVGRGFIDAVPAMQVLTLAYVLAHAQASAWNLMFGMEKHHFMAKMSLVEVAIIIGGCIALVPRYGVFGAAVATAAGMVLTKVLVQPVYVSRLIGMSLRNYFKPLLGPVTAAVSIAAAAWALEFPDLWRDCALPLWFLSGGLVGVLYAVLCAALTYRAPFFVNPLPRALTSVAEADHTN